MTRKTKQQKINNIEDQIKELEERKKQMLDSLHKDIGKTIVTSWNCSDDKILKDVIELIKEEAIHQIKLRSNQ